MPRRTAWRASSTGWSASPTIIETGGKAEARTASNLAAAYAGALSTPACGTRLERDAQVPEPELEHCFKVVLAFDQVREALPPAAAELKIDVVEGAHRALLRRASAREEARRARAARGARTREVHSWRRFPLNVG